MLEFMGITPGPKKERDMATMSMVSSKPIADGRPNFEALYNEAMQQLRQREEMLNDAGFILRAMESKYDAELAMTEHRHLADEHFAIAEKAREELDRYADTIEALRKRTEIPF